MPQALRVSGKWRHWPTREWRVLKGPKPDDEFHCDGCSWSPDTYKTLTGRKFELWPACVIHDYHYRCLKLGKGTSAEQRRWADAVFRHNLRLLVFLQGGSAWTQQRVSWLYWGRVRMWGASSWRHWGDEEPMGWWARLREVWGRG